MLKSKFKNFLKSIGGGLIDTIPFISTVKNSFVKKETSNSLFNTIDYVRLITNGIIVIVILYLLKQGFDINTIKEVIDIVK